MRPQIVIGLSEHGLDSVPTAGGLRADGRVDVDERYGMDVTTDTVRIWGPSPEAVHRGMTSLRQLATAGMADSSSRIAVMRANDGPRFAWRGLSLDISRTFHGPETLRRVIDMCSLFKLNVLHLHLTDNEGWRFEVPNWPLLTEIGGLGATGDRRGGWLTREDVAALVAYAAERFVTIVPEVDIPGHAGAVFAAYPELGPNSPTAISFGGMEVPIGTLDPDCDVTWRFVEDVVDAVVAQFPQSGYVHIGGDETFGMPDATHAAFVQRAIEIVKSRGRKAVGWQEVARAAVGEEELVQHWMDFDAMGSNPKLEDLKALVPEEFLSLLMDNIVKSGADVPASWRGGHDSSCRRRVVSTLTGRTPRSPPIPVRAKRAGASDSRCTHRRPSRTASTGTRST